MQINSNMYKKIMKDKINNALLKVKNKLMISEVLKDNSGMGVIEVILIILVLVGLVIIFRTQVTNIVNNVFNKLTAKVNSF